MFASVIQREHKHLVAKTSKKGKKTPKILIDNESSNSSDEDMSVDHMVITENDTDKSKTDKSNTNMSDNPSDKITDETDEDKTYQFRIQNLGSINIDWHKPAVTTTHIDKIINENYTNECYVTAAKLFNPSKKPKTKHLSSITLG